MCAIVHVSFIVLLAGFVFLWDRRCRRVQAVRAQDQCAMRYRSMDIIIGSALFGSSHARRRNVLMKWNSLHESIDERDVEVIIGCQDQYRRSSALVIVPVLIGGVALMATLSSVISCN